MMDFERAITGLAVIGLFFMLVSGFFVKDRALPSFISWLKYTSFMRYTYIATLLILLEEIDFTCGNPSDFSVCQGGGAGSGKKIGKHDITDFFEMDSSLWLAIILLFGQTIIWNILAYYFLKKNTSSNLASPPKEIPPNS